MKIRKFNPANGSLAERQPIMMTPVELPMRNYSDVTTTSDQSPARNDNTITLPTNYNTIQVDPLWVRNSFEHLGNLVWDIAVNIPCNWFNTSIQWTCRRTYACANTKNKNIHTQTHTHVRACAHTHTHSLAHLCSYKQVSSLYLFIYHSVYLPVYLYICLFYLLTHLLHNLSSYPSIYFPTH